MKVLEELKEKYRRFHEWQEQSLSPKGSGIVFIKNEKNRNNYCVIAKILLYLPSIIDEPNFKTISL